MTMMIIIAFVIGIILGLLGLRILRMGEARHTANTTPNTRFRHHP